MNGTNDNSMDQGWREEALQLRRNHAEDSAVMEALVTLFENMLPDVKTGKGTPGLPLACLALHHLAMRFHSHAGPRAMKIMMASTVDDLPPAFGDFGPRLDSDTELEECR